MLWPSIAADGKSIVFERDLGIWKFDIKTEQAQRLDIRLLGSLPIDPPDHGPLTDFPEIALSPDGKKVAGDVQRRRVHHAGVKAGAPPCT